MDRERTDAVWKKYGRSLWNFAGSYGLGIALMLILLVLTFAGTLHQVRLSSAMGSEAAIESFFGAASFVKYKDYMKKEERKAKTTDIHEWTCYTNSTS